MAEITLNERRELRAVIRKETKVRRAQVGVRKQQLLAGVEGQLARRYREEDLMLQAFRAEVRAMKVQVDRRYAKLMTKYDALFQSGNWRGSRDGWSPPYLSRTDEDKAQVRRALISSVEAWAQKALLALDTEEAALLRELTVDALDSQAAFAFLERVLTADQLTATQEPWMLEIPA